MASLTESSLTSIHTPSRESDDIHFRVPMPSGSHSSSLVHVKSRGIPHPELPHFDLIMSLETVSGTMFSTPDGHIQNPSSITGQLSTTPAVLPYDFEVASLSTSHGTPFVDCAQLVT